ncbi:MAG: hypothetical protein MSA08_03575 [Prevotella sp.]|nr:hypothetical protein [Prevotella sp.]
MKENFFFNCRYIAGNCCSRKRVGGLWSAIAINDQQLKEKIYILMDTDGGPQADGGGEQVLINDERLMITDVVHTENTDYTDKVRKRTRRVNINYHE